MREEIPLQSANLPVEGRAPILSAHVLRGRAWFDYAVWSSKLSPEHFAKQFIYRGRSRSHLIERWRSGKTLPSRLSAVAVDKYLPGTLEIFDSLLFRFLEDRAMSEKDVIKLLEPYKAPSGSSYEWAFPNDWEPGVKRHWVPIALEFDTAALARRGDVWGFIAILGLVRLAEARGDAALHNEACMDMYRALPAMLKLPWLLLHVDLLKQCLHQIRERELFSTMMFDVDWDVITRQAADPSYDPILERRPSELIDDQFTGIEDPVLPARLISGTRARELAKGPSWPNLENVLWPADDAEPHPPSGYPNCSPPTDTSGCPERQAEAPRSRVHAHGGTKRHPPRFFFLTSVFDQP
jgi:hypothetical protein